MYVQYHAIQSYVNHERNDTVTHNTNINDTYGYIIDLS